MSSAERNSSEKRILEEDCAEDRLKNGILTLTNKRLLFRKTEGKMATLSKKTGDIILDLNLNQVRSVKSEGLIIKKVVVFFDDETYKFGVFNNKKWAREIDEQININKIG